MPHQTPYEKTRIKTHPYKNYKLGAKYCRQSMEKGRVNKLKKKTKFTNVNTDEYCLDKDIEACVLKLKSTFSNICILFLYRAPSGNFLNS
jgi:hypothetical protein